MNDDDDLLSNNSDREHFIGILFCRDESAIHETTTATLSTISTLPVITVAVRRHFKIVHFGPGRKQTKRVEIKSFSRRQHKLTTDTNVHEHKVPK